MRRVRRSLSIQTQVVLLDCSVSVKRSVEKSEVIYRGQQTPYIRCSSFLRPSPMVTIVLRVLCALLMVKQCFIWGFDALALLHSILLFKLNKHWHVAAVAAVAAERAVKSKGTAAIQSPSSGCHVISRNSYISAEKKYR